MSIESESMPKPAKPETPNSTVLHIRLSDKVVDVLRDTAALERRTMHNLARIALERGLNDILSEISISRRRR